MLHTKIEPYTSDFDGKAKDLIDITHTYMFTISIQYCTVSKYVCEFFCNYLNALTLERVLYAVV